VSTLYLLFFLLLIASLGSFLMGERGVRGRGLPSGSEWVVLGFVLGPSLLGVLNSQDLELFAPVSAVAVGWIALLAGISFGTDGARRVPLPRMALGLLSALLCGAVVALAVWATLEHLPAAGATLPGARDRLLVALGCGAALAASAQQAVRWAAVRLGARGPLTVLLGDLAHSDELVPIAAAGLVIATDTSRGLPAMPGLGLLLGAGLGLLTALLLGREMRRSWMWALLFGISLLAAGVAVQLDLSLLATLFALGFFAALASPLRSEVRRIPAEVEGTIVLPALFIAGTRVSLGETAILVVVAAALAARLLGKALASLVPLAASPAARRSGPALAWALDSAGPLNVAVGLAFQLRYPGPVGNTVLAAAAAAAVVGEFVGPVALRRALRRAGELSEPAASERHAEVAS